MRTYMLSRNANDIMEVSHLATEYQTINPRKAKYANMHHQEREDNYGSYRYEDHSGKREQGYNPLGTFKQDNHGNQSKPFQQGEIRQMLIILKHSQMTSLPYSIKVTSTSDSLLFLWAEGTQMP